MKTLHIKRIISCMLISVMLIACFPSTADAAWDVKPSNVNYSVNMDETKVLFLGNKKTIGTKVGTEYYMTYTVESVKAPTLNQTGVMGTNVPTNSYPYVTVKNGTGGGIYNFNTTSHGKQDIMLKEGYSYFLKFTVTEDGYNYRVAWAEDASGKSKYIEFQNVIGDVKTDLGYFGLFIAGGQEGVTGRLTKVRFYDKKGNDLGVQSNSKTAEIELEKPLSSGITVDHRYQINLKGIKIAISNKRLATGNKIYMEYTVKSSNSKPMQSGVITSDAPKAGYPYTDGYMLFDRQEPTDPNIGNGLLLEPGAKYLLIFENNDEFFDVTVQKTINGKTTLISFPLEYGSYHEFNFKSIYLCGNTPNQLFLDAVLVDFMCYDSNGNNLGVQVNDTGVAEVIHFGEREDYAGCEAMYFCDDDESLYALYEDKSLKFTESDATQDGTYQIYDYRMTVKLGDAKKEYDYLYEHFTDENEKVYERLHTCKLIFNTGAGSAVETQVLNADNGYAPMRPNAPTLEGNEFEGWYTIEGEKFDFDKIVTESQTVYAKWSNVEFKPVDNTDGVMLSNAVYIAGAVLILAAAITCGVVIVVRGKKNGTGK